MGSREGVVCTATHRKEKIAASNGWEAHAISQHRQRLINQMRFDYNRRSGRAKAKFQHVAPDQAKGSCSKKSCLLCMGGGEGGIRTLEGLATFPVFETGTFNHSATSPREARFYQSTAVIGEDGFYT
jgi:hypothetical protein